MKNARRKMTWSLFGYLVCLAVAADFVGSASGQVVVQRIKSFGIPEVSGANPLSSLIIGTDGMLYGTCSAGGSKACGGVFKVGQSGGDYHVIHSFAGTDGRAPEAALLQDSSGALYGTTPSGGTNDLGTVFRLNPDGSSYSVLHHFDGTDGWRPRGGLLRGSDGLLYGTASSGGAGGGGVVFKIATNGSGFAVIHTFSGPDGAAPFGKLVFGTNGALYGTTYSGGASNLGTVFTIGTDGSGYSVIHSFTKGMIGLRYDGWNPRAGLTLGMDGMFYGTCSGGGGTTAANQHGTVFQIASDGSGMNILLRFNTIFPYDSYGINPIGEVIQGADGYFYGTTSGSRYTGGAGTVFRVDSTGNSSAVIYGFNTSGGGAANPNAGLVQDANGVLYGTSYAGGKFGYGTIFKLDTSGNFTLIQSLSLSGGDSQGPLGTLAQDENGIIYGVSWSGGSNALGTVYSINTSGSNYSILRAFSGPDAANPGALMLGPDNVLYGTSAGGGISNSGTIFKINRNGTGYSAIHGFTGADGTTPYAGLMLGADGAFYSTTAAGGAYGDGTIFKVNMDGTGFLVIHTFNHNVPYMDGSESYASLVQGSDGALYGGSYHSSYPYYPGTLFKVDVDGGNFNAWHSYFSEGGFPSGPYAGLLKGNDQKFYGTTIAGVIFKFDLGASNYTELRTLTIDEGQYPKAELTFGDDSALYGTAEQGGSARLGTLFKINPDGSGFGLLHTFGTSSGDGHYPHAPLLRGRDGLLYGTTLAGGDMDCGTVFRLVPLPRIDSFARSQGVPFRFTATGVSNFTYAVQASSNVVDWSTLTNMVAASNRFEFVDSAPGTFEKRFYRVVWIP